MPPSQASLINVLAPGIACGLAGALICALNMMGIGIKLSSAMVRFSAGNMHILLMLSSFVAFALGFGLGSVVVYIIVVVLVAPALYGMGMLLLCTHLFVYYYGMISHVTLPVARAVYIGSISALQAPQQPVSPVAHPEPYSSFSQFCESSTFKASRIGLSHTSTIKY